MLGIGASALGAGAIGAAPASAATISYDSGATIVYSADAGDTLNTYVGYSTACGTDCATFSDGVTMHYPTAQCATFNNRLMCALGAGGVRVAGGDGNDSVSVLDQDIGGFPAGFAQSISIDGSAGNDTITGGSAAETIHGGAGADRLAGGGGDDVLYGDDGNDVLLGDGSLNSNDGSDGGNDHLYGGAGDDKLTGDSTGSNARIGADVLDGGPGTDTAYDDWYRASSSDGTDEDPPPTVSFDGVANDGRPGEGDNVVNVEAIDTGYLPSQASPATFSGDDGPNTFNRIFASGVVHAGAGNDVLTGSDHDDTLDGGPGDDIVYGGFGDDVITGGPGRDQISGDRNAACFYGPIYGTCTTGSGNDTIYAQDGESDTVDCGPGSDVAFVDSIDTVSGCETVHVTAAPGGGGGDGGGGGAGGGGGSHALPRAPLAVVSWPHRLSLRALARTRALGLSCRLAGRGRCQVRLTISARDARRLRLRVARHSSALTLGTASRTLRRAGAVRLRIGLGRPAARALPRARRLRLTLVVSSSAAGHRARTGSVHRMVAR